MAKPTHEKFVLLVEGKDDEAVIYHLKRHAAIHQDAFRVKTKDGYSNLLDTLAVELEASELETLGIVVDADSDLNARWESIRNRLRNLGYTTMPDRPQTQGIIVDEANKPSVGVWVMPNNQLPGMLEDFVALLIPTADNLWSKAKNCVNLLPEEERRFAEVDLAKAYMYTWLAWQKQPGTPMGAAINQRYLDPDRPIGKEFITWVKRLFQVQ
ncbi:MAG: DUF3226 domain-containing protein [Caldilineaceae bacterium]